MLPRLVQSGGDALGCRAVLGALRISDALGHRVAEANRPWNQFSGNCGTKVGRIILCPRQRKRYLGPSAPANPPQPVEPLRRRNTLPTPIYRRSTHRCATALGAMRHLDVAYYMPCDNGHSAVPYHRLVACIQRGSNCALSSRRGLESASGSQGLRNPFSVELLFDYPTSGPPAQPPAACRAATSAGGRWSACLGLALKVELPVGGTPPCAQAIRLAKSCDSNRLPVKKKQKLSDFLASHPAVSLRRWG